MKDTSHQSAAVASDKHNNVSLDSEALLSQWRMMVNTYLSQYWGASTSAAGSVDPLYRELAGVIGTLLEKGGKRFRPTMTYLGYACYGGIDYAYITPVAAAHELLHLSMLIHDDIIDRDTVRYGMPNVLGTYLNKHAAIDPDLGWHTAISEALLAGDMVLSAAHDIILKSSLKASHKVQMLHFISNSIFDVIGGEHVELEALFEPIEKVNPLLIAIHKTTRYSFVNPLLSGAQLARAPETDMPLLEGYAQAMGVAFQLADDLLGIYGDEAVTGKPTTSDIAEGKRSLLMQKGFALAKGADLARLKVVFGTGSCSSEERDEVKEILTRSGAKTYVDTEIERYAQMATDYLERTSLGSERKQPLRAMITKVSQRSA